jgi:hypothetical protein
MPRPADGGRVPAGVPKFLAGCFHGNRWPSGLVYGMDQLVKKTQGLNGGAWINQTVKCGMAVRGCLNDGLHLAPLFGQQFLTGGSICVEWPGLGEAGWLLLPLAGFTAYVSADDHGSD